ncbi:5-bromo-4-chloroindolyl phosphate hydrolysis family protein [Globicatella sulfidifaciens]
MVKQNLLSFLGSLIFFLIFWYLLDWPLYLVLVLTLILFFAIYFLITPKIKIGNVEVLDDQLNKELADLYQVLGKNVKRMEQNAKQIEDQEVAELANSLTAIGFSIYEYLDDHLQALSASRHFIEYYTTKSEEIIENYYELERVGVSANKLQQVKAQTTEALGYLNQIFNQQRDSYHQQKYLNLELQTDLLEKTAQMGEDFKQEEQS